MWWIRQHEHAICLPYEQKVSELIKKNNVKGFKKKRANSNSNRGGQNDWNNNDDEDSDDEDSDDEDRNEKPAEDEWQPEAETEEEDDGAFGFSDDEGDDECTDWTKKAH